MGNLSDYAKLASEEHKNINYYGMINYEEALNVYSKSDIMYAIYDPSVPNHRYSAPNKVYEAMMHGKPIVVAKDTSVDDIVRKDNMGFIIEYDKNDFESVLYQISNNPSILKEYCRNAYEAYEKYSWEEMKKRIINIYDNMKCQILISH
jgi:glycosyltransferase involved in cell wall biosynthesis